MSATSRNRAFIGIGSNIGDAACLCESAIGYVLNDGRAGFPAVSSLYSTSPVSPIAQDDFINCALVITWTGSPDDLLELLNRIEREMGRVRQEPQGPRVIDLDILLFGNTILGTPSLTIPHPQLHRRKFALVPCLEIDPAIVHPLWKTPLRAFLEGIDETQRISMSRTADEVLGRIERARATGRTG
jgi:2-amino-4-hydroxy-6-hydroxymethyldihydropteridine diphosphokinase